MKDKIVTMRQAGYGIKEISRLLGIPKSTVSYNCDGVQIKDTDRLASVYKRQSTASKIGSDRAKANWVKRIDQARAEADQEWTKIKDDPESMGFLGLYWGEGGKTGEVNITNGDHRLICVALAGFRRLGLTPKVVIQKYPEQPKEECEIFWRQLTGLDVKIHNKHGIGNKKHARLKYGICRLRIGDYKIFHKLMRWIELWFELHAGNAST